MRRLLIAALVLGACGGAEQIDRGADKTYEDGSRAHRYDNGVVVYTMPNGMQCYVVWANSSALACPR